ncbi:MAG TPA: transcriptional repressor [Myxococcales bacterium]|nr:transcriptional repressor [Myxococcales bacterium]
MQRTDRRAVRGTAGRPAAAVSPAPATGSPARPADFRARAEAALRRSGGRMTASRRALIALLAAQPRPWSPRELHRELRRRGVSLDPVSVYRNLDALLERGLLHREPGSRAVRPCSEGPGPRAGCHHAIVCTSCGTAREFDCAKVAPALEQVRRAFRFRLEDHVLELRGVCARCSRSA